MRAKVAVILAVLGLLGAGCHGSGSKTAAARSPSSSTTATTEAAAAGTKAAAGSPCEAPHPPGQSTETFTFDGRPRSYQLYVPRTYAGHGPVPVVFNFHGYGSNAVQQMIYGDFRPLAERDTFLIVAPDGQGEGASRHFNLTSEPGLQDDLAMVNALLDNIEQNFCVDTARIYSTGMSDGGAMTSALACRHFDRFAAFGAVAVILYLPGCGGSTPVAITAFMGTDDPVVPFNGGKVNCCGGAVLGSAPKAMADWAQHDGCAAAPTEDRLGTEVRRQTWAGCGGASAVVFYIIDGGGHTWPGSIPLPRLGLTTQQIKASDTIWDFFKAHPRL